MIMVTINKKIGINSVIRLDGGRIKLSDRASAIMTKPFTLSFWMQQPEYLLDE